MIQLLSQYKLSEEIQRIVDKILQKKPVDFEEGIVLFTKTDLPVLGILAKEVKKEISGDKVFFNKNIHVEPTNICIYNCKFCSYRRKRGQEGSWEFTANEILDQVNKFKNSSITEIHIVGGVHPEWDTFYWGKILKSIKKNMPQVNIKAFTAVELEHMFKKSHLTIKEGIEYLKQSGLNALPGGGAEIFHSEIRSQICNEKTSAENWLKIHETAHLSGIKTNATMLYGHIEKYEHRLDHLMKLRDLQDKTGGFSAFIPLKFRSMNNLMEKIGEVSIIEDLKNYAVSRIFLHNFPHIKSYWPMLGKNNCRMSLAFGVDDIDGTIEDSTKIYSMAGAEDEHPKMTESELVNLIKQERLIPVERDTFYNELKVF